MAKKFKRGDIVASSRSRQGSKEEDYIKDLLGRAVEKISDDLVSKKIQLEVEKNVSIDIYKDDKLN